jgi:hypothetical protein
MRQAMQRANGLVSSLSVGEEVAPGGATNAPRPASATDIMVSPLAVEAL